MNSRKRDKVCEFIRKWLTGLVPLCHLYPDFPFDLRILLKRVKFSEIHPLGEFCPIDLP